MASLLEQLPTTVAGRAPASHYRHSVQQEKFSVDDRLRRNVQFWVKVYTEHPQTEGVIHDSRYIDHIYEIVDVSGHHGMRRAKESKKKWRAVLSRLHKLSRDGDIDVTQLSPDERHIYELFLDINEPNKFLNATHRKRLRFQLGQRDRFLDGFKQSGRYLTAMEEIFRREGLPVELTRLPFVESSFNTRARSKVGASGVWQFMRSTGRLFLKVNDAVDERNDPLLATQAAARLLKLNFESLNSWPLAVTAYNHGRKGMMRAVRRTGTDELEELVSEYRSRSFGFASSNFFTELLAAIEVERNAERYFGKVARETPNTDIAEVVLPDYIAFRDLVGFMKINAAELKALNPALTEAVFKGERLIPAGYALRLPVAGATLVGEGSPKGREEVQKNFMAAYAEIPAIYKQRSQRTQRLAKVAGRRHRRVSSMN